MSLVKVFEVNGDGRDMGQSGRVVRVIAVDFGEAAEKYRAFVKSEERFELPGRNPSAEWPKEPVSIELIGKVFA